ncbi:hypothetical protein [Klebsiella aerogenes]|uniref:hypothetical protein n=1 Tax=Klebsiella aerogenes TaxID=548 RepID=UPI002551327B|nr:hypothetical protein [Klebsiella aerogenes]EKZ5287275.1 hypothetical protein [Klebsiella aerogenes]MDK7100837.1 hypothetical protein [Klebsiella aerogenes]MDK7645684.1 hypothetical protein [Klebsiella aerogenes]MDK7850708.1 hypothetical protein [Klebsiella aerogenes]MDK8313946.1 hypothetical protein [Klebsiella aerogenes]
MRIRFLSRLNKHYLMIFFASTIIIMCTLILLIDEWDEHEDNKLSCSAVTNIYKGDEHLSLRLSYSFLGDYGIATFAGLLTSKEGITSKISRQVCFKYRVLNENYYLENKRTMISLQDTAEPSALANMLPSFYEKTGARLTFQIYPQGTNGLIFVKDFTPVFYCKVD